MVGEARDGLLRGGIARISRVRYACLSARTLGSAVERFRGHRVRVVVSWLFSSGVPKQRRTAGSTRSKQQSHTKAPRRRFPFLVVPTIADDVVVTRVLARALPQLGARDSHSRPLALRRQDVRRHRGDGVGGGWTRGAQRSRAVRPQRPRRGNGDFRARRDGHQDGWFRCQEHHETRPPCWCCVRQGRDQGR